MKNKRLIFVLLLILNVVLIGIIYNVIDKNFIIIKESKIIKEMTETEYESKITELNKSHTEYATQVQLNKKKIADAITNQGVQTLEDDTIETMTENIGKIVGKDDITFTLSAYTTGSPNYWQAQIINFDCTNFNTIKIGSFSGADSHNSSGVYTITSNNTNIVKETTATNVSYDISNYNTVSIYFQGRYEKSQSINVTFSRD